MNKTIKFVIVVLALGLFALPVFAEDAPEKEKNNNAAGIYAMGWNSGIGGLQYQHWFDNFGIQVTLGGYATESNHYDYDKLETYLDSYFSAGVHLMYSCFSTNQAKPFYTRFYLWGMGGAIGGSGYEKAFLVDGCAGIGLGAELVFWHRMSIPIEFGFAGNFPNEPNLSFSSAIGLRFRF